MHRIFAVDPFDCSDLTSSVYSHKWVNPVLSGSFFFLLFMERGKISSQLHTQARRPSSASALTFHGFVLMFTAGRQKSVLLWRRKELGGVDSGGAPGWAGSPHVDVQSLESSLLRRHRGVMMVKQRQTTERGLLWAVLFLGVFA